MYRFPDGSNLPSIAALLSGLIGTESDQQDDKKPRFPWGAEIPDGVNTWGWGTNSANRDPELNMDPQMAAALEDRAREANPPQMYLKTAQQGGNSDWTPELQKLAGELFAEYGAEDAAGEGTPGHESSESADEEKQEDDEDEDKRPSWYKAGRWGAASRGQQE